MLGVGKNEQSHLRSLRAESLFNRRYPRSVDLLCDLLAQIERHQAAFAEGQTCWLFLGDLIDRGPDSRAGLIISKPSGHAGRSDLLQGNHERASSARGGRRGGDAGCSSSAAGMRPSYGVAPDVQATLNAAVLARS